MKYLIRIPGKPDRIISNIDFFVVEEKVKSLGGTLTKVTETKEESVK